MGDGVRCSLSFSRSGRCKMARDGSQSVALQHHRKCDRLMCSATYNNKLDGDRRAHTEDDKNEIISQCHTAIN